MNRQQAKESPVLQLYKATCVKFLCAVSTASQSDQSTTEVEYSPAQAVVYRDDVPKSFSDIAATVSKLCWDGGGPEFGFEITDDEETVADAWLFDELDDDQRKEIESTTSVEASFLAGQNGLFFDPQNKLSNGEPGLAFICHEEVEWVPCSSVTNFDYGQILLRLLADAVLETDYVEEVYN